MLKPTKFRDKKDSMLIFNLYKDFNGKKYNYGGTYPFDRAFIKKMKKLLNGNGFDVQFQFKKKENKVIVWSRKL